MSSDSTISIAAGHVGLVLLGDGDSGSSFYLEIPVVAINANSLDPARYLLFVAWCVLGAEGMLSLEHGGEALGPEVNIQEECIYYYVREPEEDELRAVDLEVIKMKTTTPSETREEFRTRLLERDSCCVWTGMGAEYGNGLHIIPFKRGSEWLRLIVENRLQYDDEDVDDLDNINDIHPERIPWVKDIPTTVRDDLPDQVLCPRKERYTLQWLIPDQRVQLRMPNNSDAAFRKHKRFAKPSSLLVHYNYGCAAVKWWGRNVEVLQARKLAKAEAARSKTGGKGQTTRRSGSVRATKVRHGAAPVVPGVSPAEVKEGLGKETKWDEDDVMLYLWGNSRAAKDLHIKKTQENTERMERWKEGFSYV